MFCWTFSFLIAWQMFGEDLIGCLFMKNEWVMRETALRHLSREIVMLLSHPSEQDMTASPTGQSSRTSSASSQSSSTTQSSFQSRIEYVLEVGCQILTMMIADPVYKVYVASLVSRNWHWIVHRHLNCAQSACIIILTIIQSVIFICSILYASAWVQYVGATCSYFVNLKLAHLTRKFQRCVTFSSTVNESTIDIPVVLSYNVFL